MKPVRQAADQPQWFNRDCSMAKRTLRDALAARPKILSSIREAEKLQRSDKNQEERARHGRLGGYNIGCRLQQAKALLGLN